MMRAWENRPDTFVCDEPFYAYYLKETGLRHPLADEIIATGQTNWQKVVDFLTHEVPKQKTIFFQKQMTHHLLRAVDRDWLAKVTNCFLIRDPREVIVSYIKKNKDPTSADVGFEQQAEIFNWVRNHFETIPPVLDAEDVLENPKRLLGLLCDLLGVGFSDEMLAWPPGPRKSDGVWGRHWYREVEASTSFRPYAAKTDPVPEQLRDLYEQSVACYQSLYIHRIH